MEGVAGIVRPSRPSADTRCTRRDASSTRRRSTPPSGARRPPEPRRSSSWTTTAQARLELQLSRARHARPRLRVRRPVQLTQYTEFLEEGCDACLLVGMHAMAGTPDGVMNHTVSGREWHNPPLQRRPRRRVGHQRGDVRELGLSCPARDRRRGRLPRGQAAARRRADHGRGEEGPGARAQRETSPPTGPRGDRGGRPRRADLERAVQPYDPGRPPRSRSTSSARARSRSTAAAPASRSRARGRSSSAPTTGGRHGATFS